LDTFFGKKNTGTTPPPVRQAASITPLASPLLEDSSAKHAAARTKEEGTNKDWRAAKVSRAVILIRIGSSVDCLLDPDPEEAKPVQKRGTRKWPGLRIQYTFC
jgi:hypothetical protein